MYLSKYKPNKNLYAIQVLKTSEDPSKNKIYLVLD